jgi:tRNA 2-thiouridine synthesizing protein A
MTLAQTTHAGDLAPQVREPDAMVDLTGLTCPGPILGAKQVLEGLREGQVLLLVSDCPGSRDDLFAWARQTGNEVIHTETRADGAVGYYLRKGRAGPVAAHVRLDLRGVVCPGPIVEAKHLLKGMRRGEVLKLVSDCAGVREDIIGWARVTGVEVVAIRESEAGVLEFFLRKG